MIYSRMQNTALPVTHLTRRMPARSVALVCICLAALLLVTAGCDSSHAPTSTPTPSGPFTGSDWHTYHANATRTGYVAGTADPHSLTTLWKQPLDGAVYGEPLVIGGRVIVATEHNSLYALDAHSGQVVWHTSVAGDPVPRSALPCGDIDPLGITGTPVYDPQSHLVFAVAETQQSGHVVHLLVGVNGATGHLTISRSIDPAGIDPLVEQQRGALALANGRVYVAFGGLDGDCGDYHGLVVASQIDGIGPLLSYVVPSPREAGIWTTPGPSIDAQGNLYVAVGNGAVTQPGAAWDHSDAILRLSPTLQLEDGFAPQSWPDENANDLDLGSMGPVLLPNGLIYANGKSGMGYLLRANALGGVGGQLQTLQTCRTYGGAAVSGLSLYIPCTDGLRQLTLAGSGSRPQLALGWHASSKISGSPVVGGATVYSLDPFGGTLYALDATTGAVRASVSVGEATRFATPTLSGNLVFVGTAGGVTAVSIG